MSAPRNEHVRALAAAAKRQAEDLKRWGIQQVPRRRRAPSTAMRALERQVQACTKCRLYRTANRHVFGEGSLTAQLVFVGEGPGFEEDRQGRPFVGAAGQLLTKMIAAMGLTREAVYICNVIKHRPPENRLPEPDEVEACTPYLEAQLAAIKPRVICALGAVAAKALLGPDIAITRIRGQRQEYQGMVVVPTFYPAYLLRNPDAKRDVWKDLKLVMKLLESSPRITRPF